MEGHHVQHTNLQVNVKNLHHKHAQAKNCFIYVRLLGVLGMQETLASNLHVCHLLANNVAVVGTAWVMMILLHALAPYVQMLDHALGNNF